MTREELIRKHQRLLMGFRTECYCVRKMAPSEFGMDVERQWVNVKNELEQMLKEFMDAKQVNGQTPRPATAVVPGVKR